MAKLLIVIKKGGFIIMFSIGQLAITGLLSHIIFILITWYVMQAINFEPIIRKNRTTEARIFFSAYCVHYCYSGQPFFLYFLTLFLFFIVFILWINYSSLFLLI